jgi:hypothetical protein
MLRLEGSPFGLLSNRRFTLGAIGSSEAGFCLYNESPRDILNSVLSVQCEPGTDKTNHALPISWRISDEQGLFSEMIARWGYPWWLMLGGRHEVSVSDPFGVPGQGALVQVRSAASHDYGVVTGELVQKLIPA